MTKSDLTTQTRYNDHGDNGRTSTGGRKPHRRSPATDREDPELFRRSKTKRKRLKVLLWGDAGTGKTSLALQFPGVAMIDTEGGSELYSDDYNFSVLSARNPDEVMRAVDFLQAAKHSYKTFVLDPFTVYWEALQKKYSDIFLQRNKASKGHRYDFYQIQFGDWNIIKSELRDFYRRVLSLDMNVIFTAREKAQYSDSDFTRKVGETFDGEKSLPYIFDVILRLTRTGEDFCCQIIKDRGQRLGTKREFSASSPKGLYEIIQRAYGDEHLRRDVQPAKRITGPQEDRLVELVRRLNVSEEKVKAALEAYGAETFADLSYSDAEAAIEKLEAKLELEETAEMALATS